MKRIQSIAAVALLAAVSAYAQTYNPAVPRGLPDSASPQSRELAQPGPGPAGPAVQTVDPAVPRLVMDRRRGHNDADARRCLQLGSNRQIHQCAHRYLPREARARITQAKAAKSARSAKAPATAASPIVRSKTTADLGKADLSKAGSPAKPVETAKVVPPAAPSPSGADKPSATPRPAAPSATVEKSGDKPKWTDGAKALIQKQGDRLPQ
jgi:hypothetical protein